MISYSYLETFSLFLGALTLSYCTYEEVVKRLAKKPGKPAIKPSLKPPNKPSVTIAQPVVKKVLHLRFEVEIKDSKEVHKLTKENFKELLSPYFIAVDYLRELWLVDPFNLTVTDRIQEHYGKEKKVEGFIRNKAIPDIFIKFKTNNKHRCGILLHELAHHQANKEAKLKNVRICSHGKEFKRHLRLLFAPLLVDKTYYKKHHELSYHLTYEANRFTPTRDQCA